MADTSAPVTLERRLGGASVPRPYFDLFLISFLILFFELACIRWFGSMVVFLTFFTNIILLATFLGMSVGCLAARGTRNWVGKVVPLLLSTALAARLVLALYRRFGRLLVDVGGQGSPQQIYFGTEYRALDVSTFVVPIEVLAGIFFVLIALVFIGMGQVMGRAFDAAPDRLKGYTANIGGSLAGIAAFSAMSFLRTTPLAWFAIGLAVWMYFLPRWTPLQTYGVLAALSLAAMTGYNNGPWAPYESGNAYELQYWSPYYKIQYNPWRRSITTNNIGHQTMHQDAGSLPSYLLPHLLNRETGGKPFEDVLIIGAGSGNDVAAALKWGARHVDAVEIDPAIYETGRANHPDAPYADPRVSVHIDDGRSFLRKTTRQYDLVIYALVDSLVLQSGHSSVRLESFLFTQEAFADIRARLKPGGMFTAYNYMRQGWLVGRIDRMMEAAFGARPVVISLPYAASIGPSDPQTSRITAFLAGGATAPVTAIRARFAADGSFWLNSKAGVHGFSPQPPAIAGADPADWLRMAPAAVQTESGPLPTDDWPFLYLHEPSIPALNIRSILLLGGLSLAILMVFSPVKQVRPNWQMFFLGAGFMLLETKGVVHVAMLFGSTWIVNSVVFFAILLMILCANVYTRIAGPKASWPYYVLLLASLGANLAIPMNAFLALPEWQKVTASCAVVFLPVFFAGVVFAMAFRESETPDLDFGSNVAGAVLGGLAENLSLVLGFNHLLIVAIGFYLLSAILRRRGVALPAISAGV